MLIESKQILDMSSWGAEGLTGAVAGPHPLHGLQHVLINLIAVEDRVVAVLWVVCWAGIVQIWPQAMQREALRSAQMS